MNKETKEFIDKLQEVMQDGDDELYEDKEGVNWCNWDLLQKRVNQLIGDSK